MVLPQASRTTCRFSLPLAGGNTIGSVTVNADGSFGVEQRIGFSLTADHRVIDGADAARFLQDLASYVENIDVTVLG